MSGNLLPLTQAISQFVASLPSQDKATYQQELAKFLRWFGFGHPLADLSAQALENYQEQLESSGAGLSERLEPLRAFLIYAHQQSYLASNLAKYVRVKRGARPRETKKVEPARLETTVELTSEGLSKMKAELDYLVNQVRPQVAQELYEARQDKDIRENAPYEAARERQGMIEARIRELQGILGSARLVAGQTNNQRVGIGHTVLLRDLARQAEVKYTLVDPRETDPGAAKISVASPVGKALLEREEGEVVEVQTPAGLRRYRIERIEA